MGVFRQFPYSNFHEMNLDEIIKIVKNMLEEWAQYHAEWDTWKNQLNDDWSNYQEVMNEAWQNMQDFINNYFDNLDVQEEINNKIVSMVNTGEFASIVQPFIPPEVSAWLEDNITEPEGVVIDTSLSVAGACADAKATGDAIHNIKTNIGDIDILEPIRVENYYANYNDGSLTHDGAYGYIEASNIGAYEKLHIITNNPNGVTAICFYDSNDDWILSLKTPGEESPYYYDDYLTVPEGAEKIRVSCLKIYLNNASIIANTNDISRSLKNVINTKATLPLVNTNISYILHNGIISRSLSVFTTGDDYTGRYTSLSVVPGEKYSISCRAVNDTYPGAFVTLNGTFAGVLLGGSNTSYVNETITIPNNTDTLYVNGIADVQNVYIQKRVPMTQESFNEWFGDVDSSAPLKCVYKNNVLYVKKKYDSTKDICISFANVGGNNLFNFRNAFYIANTEDIPNNNFDDIDALYLWGMSASDWLGPYVVSADNNKNGDNITSGYFTGGNHRTTNSGTGGGITAEQTNLKILIDGVSNIQSDVIYSCNSVKVTWSNNVQAYDTSKVDGSGRNVLTETWNMEITKDGIYLHNTIKALEDITLKKYYGFQATASDMQYEYIGGDNRNTYSIGVDTVNSGNNTCRTANVFDDHFNLNINIDAVDLGLFSHNGGYSYFAAGSKMYGFLVDEAHEISITANEKYHLVGSYVFD